MRTHIHMAQWHVDTYVHMAQWHVDTYVHMVSTARCSHARCMPEQLVQRLGQHMSGKLVPILVLLCKGS